MKGLMNVPTECRQCHGPKHCLFVGEHCANSSYLLAPDLWLKICWFEIAQAMQSFDWPVYLADEEKIIFWCLPFFTFYRCAVCKPTTGLNYSANIRKTDWRLENHTRKWPDWGHVVKCIHADLLKAISLRTSNFKPAKGCTATVLSQLPNNLTLL